MSAKQDGAHKGTNAVSAKPTPAEATTTSPAEEKAADGAGNGPEMEVATPAAPAKKQKPVAGGRYVVNGRLVDAHGEAIEE